MRHELCWPTAKTNRTKHVIQNQALHDVGISARPCQVLEDNHLATLKIPEANQVFIRFVLILLLYLVCQNARGFFCLANSAPPFNLQSNERFDFPVAKGTALASRSILANFLWQRMKICATVLLALENRKLQGCWIAAQIGGAAIQTFTISIISDHVEGDCDSVLILAEPNEPNVIISKRNGW